MNANAKPTRVTIERAKRKPAGDIDDIVRLEAELAKSHETIAKQRETIVDYHRMVAGIVIASDMVKTYKWHRHTAETLREANAQDARSFGSHGHSGCHYTPCNVIDASMAWTCKAVELANAVCEVFDTLDEAAAKTKGR